MSKNKTSVEIPTFNKPTPPSYNIPGFGNTTYGNNTYGFNFAPQQAGYNQNLNNIRDQILAELGITSPQRAGELQKWNDTFTNEALRTSMPQLEQTLFARGLGGSEFYKGAVNDLLSKVATQGALNSDEMRNRDEALKLSQLAAISGLSQQDLSNIMSMLGASTSTGLSEEQMAMKQYQATLPYLAKVNQKSSPWGTVGSLVGAGAGALFGGPMGAGIGSSIGGGLGGLAGGSPSQLDLSWLSMLGGGGGGTANVEGMGSVPIAPANYYLGAGRGAF